MGRGQNTSSPWTGQLTAEAEPLPAASVVAYRTEGGAILAFSISDDTGGFELNIPEATDSFWLEITHLAYDPVKEWVRTKQSNRNWVLGERSIDLPSLTVTQPVMQRRGDTLVFDFTQLREDNDDNIEDVLKRIPGITVTASGLIRYRGLEISKFYIEGLDLLEGRYALATRYLNPDAIRDVEVLEEHQPIRALDSLVRPPNAALNLRLKSGITLSATAEGGVGGLPGIARLRSDVFSFSPKRQANVLLAGNNTGSNDRSAFRDFYTDQNVEADLVNASSPLPPSLLVPSEDYLDNLSGAGTFNFLNKLSKYDQLKVGGFLNADRIDYRGSNTVSFFDAQDFATLTEELAKQEDVLLGNARLLYEKNAPNIYWKTTLQHDWRTQTVNSNNLLNNVRTIADQQTDQHDLRLNTNLILRRGSRAREVFGSFERKTVSDSFRVAPVSVFSDLSLITAAEARQQILRRVHHGEVYTRYYLRLGKLVGQMELNGQLHADRLTADLNFFDPAEEPALTFANATRQQRVTVAGSPKLRRETNKYVFSIRAPFGAHFVSLRDAGRPNEQTRIPFVEPSLEYARKLPKSRGLSATIAYHNDYDQDRLLFSAYLLRNERELERRVFQLNRFQKYEGKLRFVGPLFKDKIQFESYGQFTLNQRNFIDATDFSQQGAAVEQLTGTSTQRNLLWTNSLATILWKSLSAKLEYRRTQVSVPLILNGADSRVNTGIDFWKLKLSKVFTRQVITATGSWNHQKNDLIANQLQEWYVRLAYFQQLGRKNADIQFNVQQFYVTTGKANASNWLLDLRFRRPVLAGKFQLIVHLRNLTNTENFTSLGLYAFSSQVSNFRLRPRQLWVGLERSF